VEVLCEHQGHPVVVREGAVVACSFHPELTDDSRLHALLMAIATGARERDLDRTPDGIGQPDEQAAG
jgi:5'-phosphate synthase pdxT subunit